MCARLEMGVVDTLSRIETSQRSHAVHVLASRASTLSLRNNNVLLFLEAFRGQSEIECPRGPRLRYWGPRPGFGTRRVRGVALIVLCAEVWKQHANETFRGWRTSRDDVNGGLGDGYDDSDVPGAIGIGRSEPIVVYDETADRDPRGTASM